MVWRHFPGYIRPYTRSSIYVYGGQLRALELEICTIRGTVPLWNDYLHRYRTVRIHVECRQVAFGVHNGYTVQALCITVESLQ